MRLIRSATDARKGFDYQRCFNLLEQARKLYPRAFPPVIELGRAHGMRYNYALARRYFDEAVKMSGRHPKVLILIGLHSLEFEQHALAREYFELATKQTSAPVDAFSHLAEIYERQNRLDDASIMVERALKIDSKNALANLVHAQLHRRAGRLEEAEKALKKFLAAPSDDKDGLPRCWYELGNILDRMGRYDDAMAAFLAAKALVIPNAGADQYRIAQARNRMRMAESMILPDVVERWSKVGEQLQPSQRFAVLSGHPRSGTTLIEQVLDSHPDIISGDENRIFLEESFQPMLNRFPKDTPLVTMLDSQKIADLQNMRSDYFRYIEALIGEKIAGRMLVEKNPALGGFIPAFMYVFPEARFLVAIRDPRDVCLSCFMQFLRPNPISSTYLTLEGTVDQYASTMSMWRVMLPRMRNPHLMIRYEDVLEDLKSESRKMLDFLGIAWDERVLRFHEHAQTKIVRSPTYSDVAKPIFKTAKGRWHNYQKYLEPCLKKLEPFVKWFGYE